MLPMGVSLQGNRFRECRRLGRAKNGMRARSFLARSNHGKACLAIGSLLARDEAQYYTDIRKTKLQMC